MDTQPYRIAMVAYAHLHGLAFEEGFDAEGHDSLGPAGRRFLNRIQTHMVAFRRNRRRVYPKVSVTGILDEPTRAALVIPRPSWRDEFVRIGRQDAANPGAAYYTQGSARWQGVRAVFGKVAVGGKIPPLRSGDCSAGYTRWVLWGLQQELGHVPRDVVNSLAWQAGYTGTIAHTMRHVAKPEVGDAVLYGRYPYKHVVGVLDPDRKLVVSHGSNAGPNIERWDYRGDIAGFWRPDFIHA